MMVRGNFSRELAPGLNMVFRTTMTEREMMWKRFFAESSTVRAYEEDATLGGFPLLQQVGELQDVPLRGTAEGFVTKYIPLKYALGYELSTELVEDNLYDETITGLPAALGRSARATQETAGAAVFNFGFTKIGADGKALFATDHPRAGGSGSDSNTNATPLGLSYSAIQTSITALKRQRGDDGIFTPVEGPFTLLVPDQLWWQALEITGSDKVPYSADNTTNTVAQQSIEVVPWGYLTDSNNWFILGPMAQTKLRFFRRRALEQVMIDVERNDSMCHFVREKYVFGYSDYRATWGVQGA